MELPPFSFPNPLGYFGGVKQIRAEAAYLYDSVHLYTDALIKVIELGGNPKNGTAIINALKGTSYMSAMGYIVYIDENGDAAGNYTILARKHKNRNKRSKAAEYGLYPVGTFSPPDIEQLPVKNFLYFFSIIICFLVTFFSTFHSLCQIFSLSLHFVASTFQFPLQVCVSHRPYHLFHVRLARD